MGAPSEEAVTRKSERRGPCGKVERPEGPSSALSMNEPARAPSCEPSVAPVMVAPRTVRPAGRSALPTAAPATARARVAMGVRW